jgi:glycosyltransferase involved in cell wall biosynthesis
MKLPLIIVGDAPPGNRYKESLLQLSGSNVRFLGGVYGPAYHQLVAHAALYVHAHEVGGTNPSLLQAMGLGKAPLYLDVPFNREVAGEVGYAFPKDPCALAALLNTLFERLDEVQSRAPEARRIIGERYSWPDVIDKYERLFRQLLV